MNKDNNLSIKFPGLAKEWHPTKNAELLPEHFTSGQNIKVWWQCSNGHSWQARISNRARSSRICPYCSGYYPTKENNLFIQFPQIAKEWNSTKNKKSPKDYTVSSNFRAHWICKYGHAWETKICNRVNSQSNCPFCSNQKAGYENTLGEKFPDLVKEWDVQKNTIKPNEVVPGSHKKVWWKCSKGHSWQAAVKKRAISKTNCPKCNAQTSAPEIRLMCELKYLFDICWQEKLGSYEVDIFIPSLKIAIEYDGSYFHKNKEKQDKSKSAYLESQGIKIIRVREIPLKKLSNLDILVKSSSFTKKDCDIVVKTIEEFSKTEVDINRYLKKRNFANQDLFNYYLSFLPDPFPEESLVIKFPEIANKWDFKKNDPLIPNSFIPGSHHRVWWKCKNNHSWIQSISDEVRRDRHCPECFRKDKKLINTYPELIKQIHPDNNIDIKELNATSPIKILWICNSGHKWEEFIHNRTKSDDPYSCPICKKEKNSIIYTKPKLYKEWDHEKNNISPLEVTPGLHLKVWWRCKNNHSWQSKVFYRSRKDRPSSCPVCRKDQRK